MPIFFVIFTLLFFVPESHGRVRLNPGERFSGRVTRLFDGDSFLLERSGESRPHDLRLSGVDAPEKRQPYSGQSRRFLEGLILNQVVDVEVIEIDFHGRGIVVVHQDGQNVNLLLVSNGWAWFNQPFADRVTPELRQQLRDAESGARDQVRGLWQDPNPQPPWEYRWQSKKLK